MRSCFLPCFRTSSKRRNQLRSTYATPTEGVQIHLGDGAVEPLARQKTDVEELIDCIAESKIKNEDQSNNSAESKEEKEKASREEESPETQIDEKNKDGHEEDEINKRSHQEESSESLFSLSISSRKKVSDAEAEVNSPIQLLCTKEASGSSPSVQLEKVSLVPSSPGKSFEDTKHHEQQPSFTAIKKGEETKELINKLDEKEGERGNGNQYRYRDCPDDGYDDININVKDLNATLEDEDDPPNQKREGEEHADVNQTWVQEESSESLFSLSADSRIRISSAKEENEVNSQMSGHATNNRITQEKIPDVLNPIQSLTKGATELHPQKNNDKENINLVVQDVNIPPINPGLKLSNRKARQEIGVDTSLSSWLVESSETTPNSVNNGEKGRRGSPWSHADRPILGALTVEEIRMHSLSASSRRTRSPSPDETPIIGTVGSYWSHTEQTMDLEFNKSGRKDVKSKRTSTALQTRLDQAFEASAAQEA